MRRAVVGAAHALLRRRSLGAALEACDAAAAITFVVAPGLCADDFAAFYDFCVDLEEHAMDQVKKQATGPPPLVRRRSVCPL